MVPPHEGPGSHRIRGDRKPWGGCQGLGRGAGSSCLKGTESESHKTESVMGVDRGVGHVVMRVCLFPYGTFCGVCLLTQ